MQVGLGIDARLEFDAGISGYDVELGDHAYRGVGATEESKALKVREDGDETETEQSTESH